MSRRNKIHLKILPDQTHIKRNEDELVGQVQVGLTQIALVSGGISKVCPAASVLDIPYTVASALSSLN